MSTSTQTEALSARNALSGTVRTIRSDAVVAEVVLDVGGGHEVAALITRASVDRLGLREGDRAQAVIKATDVMVRRES